MRGLFTALQLQRHLDHPSVTQWKALYSMTLIWLQFDHFFPIFDLNWAFGCIKIFNEWGSIQEWSSNNVNIVY